MITSDGTVRKIRHSVNEPGHAHELTFSCYKRLQLLNNDRTRMWFVEALDRARRDLNFQLWAYVIMSEHVHILLLPCAKDYQMSMILKAIKQPVSRRAMRYLRSHAPSWLDQLKVIRSSGRTEYRFWQQGGGYDRNFDNPEAAWASVEYIHNNPVRRGLVACPSDWPWSSASWYTSTGNALLKMDGNPPSEYVKTIETTRANKFAHATRSGAIRIYRS